jgi:hypothetical protein
LLDVLLSFPNLHDFVHLLLTFAFLCVPLLSAAPFRYVDDTRKLATKIMPISAAVAAVTEAMAEHDAKNDENATALFKQAFDQLMQAIASAPNETERSAFMKQMEAHVTTTGISGSSGQGRALRVLGIVYLSLDEPKKAMPCYYQLALQIAQELQDKVGQGNLLGNMGLMYEKLGDWSPVSSN